MAKIILVILLFFSVFFWEARKLVKKKEMIELAVFSFLILIGLALSIAAVIQSLI
ncbi:hypothetical protein [Bacillus sinesaloumensis]|uniref:hypothetical protein n=1 Tax=Litchfieldia sinesaloumensis TaxID=1926280 RepID=UPI001356568E|nr:hypothetical protein [Bacillus sinesaloumensis]